MTPTERQMRIVAIVTRTFAHYGRTPMPTTVADVALDVQRFELDEIETAAAELRRTVTHLRDASLSALLIGEMRAARRRRTAETPLLPRRPITDDERRAARAAVARVRSLGRRFTP